jgi:hypothetical protein
MLRPEAVHRKVMEFRRTQGLPEHVEDPAALARVAALINTARWKAARTRHSCESVAKGSA